ALAQRVQARRPQVRRHDHRRRVPREGWIAPGRRTTGHAARRTDSVGRVGRGRRTAMMGRSVRVAAAVTLALVLSATTVAAQIDSLSSDDNKTAKPKPAPRIAG